jgi:hypothetical protein
MTGYYLSSGYNSGYSVREGAPVDGWEKLKEIALRLCSQPEKIVDEAIKFGAPPICEDGCCTLLDYAMRYQPQDDGTFKIHESENDDDEAYIAMHASGDRELKEHIRRAFCRLVIYEMHKLGLEVNLSVA